MDMETVLRLVITGSPEGAVAALKEVGAATETQAAATAKANAEQTAMAKSGHNGLLLLAGGAGLVTAAVLGTVDAYAKQAEAVIQVEKLTGMNAKQASDFVVQAQAMGFSADDLGTVIGRMSKNVMGYIDGTSKSTSAMGKAFTMAGISVDDLKNKNAGQVIDEIRDKLAAMPAGLERSDVIQTIFGKGAAGNPDLLRYLTATQSQLEAVNKAAAQYGLVFSQKQLDQAAKFGAEMRMLKIEFEGIAVSIGRELAPDLAAAGKGVGDLLRLFNEVPASIRPLLMLAPGFAMMGVGIYKVEQATVGLTKAGYSAVQIVRSFIASQRESAVATKESAAAQDTESAAEKTNATAKVFNTSVTDKEIAAATEDDAALTGNDSALTANDEALAANTAAKETNAAAGGGEAAAGAAGAGELGAGAAGAGGLGAVGTAGAIAAPVVAGVLAGLYVQSKTHDFAGMSQAQIAAQLRGEQMTSHPRKTRPAAEGAVVPPEPGGTDYTVGESGGTEVIATIAQIQAAALQRGSVSPRQLGSSASAGGGEMHVHVHLDGANFYGAPDSRTARLWAPVLAQALGEQLHVALHGSRR